MVRTFVAVLMLAGIAAPALATRPDRTRQAAEVTPAQFNCDTLSIANPLDATTLRDLEPAHSLEAAAAVLTRHGVKFARSQGVMTIDSVPTKMLREIERLPQGEPIILPTDEGSAICVLRPSEDSI
jgi:hypothetical protein